MPMRATAARRSLPRGPPLAGRACGEAKASRSPLRCRRGSRFSRRGRFLRRALQPRENMRSAPAKSHASPPGLHLRLSQVQSPGAHHKDGGAPTVERNPRPAQPRTRGTQRGALTDSDEWSLSHAAPLAPRRRQPREPPATSTRRTRRWRRRRLAEPSRPRKRLLVETQGARAVRKRALGADAIIIEVDRLRPPGGWTLTGNPS